ncbi:aspartate/glutamate racemase family protein [Alphaproteobacteria bacterium]|nr:aspartate/glutamate racemase family protein [Alphaproteobacteria bacterium]
MSIVYLVPGNMTGGPYGIKELKRRENLLKEWSFNPSNIKVYDVPNGGSSIESSYEEIASIIPAVDRLSEINKFENIDAAILGCFGDPGINVFREMFDFPIIGPAQTSMHTACQLGHKFSVITVFDSMLNMASNQVHEYGLSHHLASVRAINIPVLELLKDLNLTYKKMLKLGEKIVNEDRADAILLGCMTMSFSGLDKKLEKKLGIPVLNAGRVSLKMAESLLSMEMSHSKKTYPFPPKLKIAKISRKQKA